MLYGFILTCHIIICVLLIIIVLIQSGRGGGLAEGFSGAESIFGTKTNVFLTKATTFFAILFFITCLSLAVLSREHSKSLITKGGVLPSDKKKPISLEERKTQAQVETEENKIVKQKKEEAVNTTPNKPENQQPLNTQAK